MKLLSTSELRSAKWTPGPGRPGLFHAYITHVRDLTIYAIAIQFDETTPADKSVLVIHNTDGNSVPLTGSIAATIYDLAHKAARSGMN